MDLDKKQQTRRRREMGDRNRDGVQEKAQTHDGQKPQQISETKRGQESQEGLETEEEDWSNPSVLNYWRKRR